MILNFISGPCFGGGRVEPFISTLNADLFIISAILTVITYVVVRTRKVVYNDQVVIEESINNRLSYHCHDILMQSKSPNIMNEKLPFVNISPETFYMRLFILAGLLMILGSLYFVA